MPQAILISRNQPKSLSGIETKWQSFIPSFNPGRNQPKSLSGIETGLQKCIRATVYRRAGINLNPYQGLKLLMVYAGLY